MGARGCSLACAGLQVGCTGLQPGLDGGGCRGGAHVGRQLGVLEHGSDLVVARGAERGKHEFVVVDEAVEDLIDRVGVEGWGRGWGKSWLGFVAVVVDGAVESLGDSK